MILSITSPTAVHFERSIFSIFGEQLDIMFAKRRDLGTLVHLRLHLALLISLIDQDMKAENFGY